MPKATKYTDEYITSLIGKKFGRLTIINNCSSGSRPYVYCLCECGKECKKSLQKIMYGRIRSCDSHCGTHRIYKRVPDPKYSRRLYIIWTGMKQRCSNSNHPFYSRYGGRGINICEEWKDYEAFESWALNNGYSDSLTLDRIDNNKGYSPNNCRWATRKQQVRNRELTNVLTVNGETKSIAEWSELTGISYQTLKNRKEAGWSSIAIITEPVRYGPRGATKNYVCP